MLYILMSVPLVSFKVTSILMENDTKCKQKRRTVALPVIVTGGTGAGVSVATLFYKSRLSTLTVHA